MKSLSRARLLATPWTAAYQAPPSMGFSRQEYWSGVPLPSPVATAKFPKFAGILSAALSQHHLLEFEIAQLEFPSPPLALFVAMLPKAHLTSHSRMSGSRSVTTSWLSESLRPLLYSSVYSKI